MHTTDVSLRLLRLLQLASSNLPVGGYTFSQGLEYAIDEGWLKSEAEARDWIATTLHATLVYTDVPIIKRLHGCIETKDWQGFEHFNDLVLAMRETHELLLADRAMGDALLRLARQTVESLPDIFEKQGAAFSYLGVFSLVASDMGLDVDECCTGYAWSMLENQVLAATKLLPMGQSAAQRMLQELAGEVADYVKSGLETVDAELGLSLPGLAFASARHETQYSRLYRS